jgi:ribosomal protein S18 acetylase RimI-like enzyme
LITIEKATEKELKQIQALDRMTLGSDSRRTFLVEAVSAGRCLVARDGDRVDGFGILEQSFINYGQGFIALLIVHPDFRRRGIATALIRRIEEICPTKKLFTSTNQSNVTAQKTYESLGFVRSGYIENLDEGDPEIIYFKRLADVGGRI